MTARCAPNMRCRADGSALPAGIYYVMDWNLGEFRLVNQAGVVQVPAAAEVLTVQRAFAPRTAPRMLWVERTSATDTTACSPRSAVASHRKQQAV